MSDRTVIRAAAIAALIAANTTAGEDVFSPRAWPTEPGSYPLIIVRTPEEHKENVSPRAGPPQFFSTITLTVLGRVSATTEEATEAALETLSLQIENALLTNGQFIFVNGVQQFSSVHTSMEVVANSDMFYGETVVSFGVEVFQMFVPTIDAAGVVIGPSLTEVNVVVDLNTGETLDTGLTITLPGA